VKRIAIPIVVAAGRFPAAAWANAGIGFLMVAIPAMVLAPVPAIFVEAPRQKK
jgi:hypothetical protein